jgi:hypothetical protein
VAALRRLCLILCLVSTCLPGRARAWWDDAWFDPAFLEAHSLAGGSGFIYMPSPEVLSNGLMAGGLHSYKAKVGRGFWNRLELGGTVELEDWTLNDADKNNQLYARLALLTPAKNGIALAVGADQVGFEDLGFPGLHFLPKADLVDQGRVYAVAGLVPPRLPMLYLTAGYIGGHHGASPAAAVGLVTVPGLLAIGEYDGVGTNVGLRALLSTQIKLDLSLTHLQSIYSDQPFAQVLENNVHFGVSYSEVWP